MGYAQDMAGIAGDTAKNSVRDVPAFLVQLINVARFEARRILADKRLAPTAQTADLLTVQQAYDKALEAIAANTEAALEKAAGAPAWYTPPDPLLWEAQAQRIWRRLEAQLTAGVAVQSIVQRADRQELQILSDELAGWLRANDPSISDASVAVNLAAFRELAAARMLGLWTDFELVKWKDAQAQAKGAYNLRLSLAYARGDFTQGKTIVKWDGSVVQMDALPMGMAVM